MKEQLIELAAYLEKEIDDSGKFSLSELETITPADINKRITKINTHQYIHQQIQRIIEMGEP